MSIKDILTQEYKKSNEVVNLEEELEEEVPTGSVKFCFETCWTVNFFSLFEGTV